MHLREYEALLLAPSNPRLDGSLSLVEHALRTAEACRQAYPQHDWLHLIGLIHGLGKLLAAPEYGPAERLCQLQHCSTEPNADGCVIVLPLIVQAEAGPGEALSCTICAAWSRLHCDDAAPHALSLSLPWTHHNMLGLPLHPHAPPRADRVELLASHKSS